MDLPCRNGPDNVYALCCGTFAAPLCALAELSNPQHSGCCWQGCVEQVLTLVHP